MIQRWRALVLLGALVACQHPSAPVETPPTPEPAAVPSAADSSWAVETLAELSLEEKAAQLVGVRVFGSYKNEQAPESRRLLRLVEELGVGSVVVFDSDVESLPRLLNRLQARARIPLLVAADMERGMAFRIRRGTVALPYAMAVGATGSEAAARLLGEVAAREGRALGVHWAFAPVADVNNNPDNPVINIRSFGEDAGAVAKLTAAFIRGARSGGLLTTAKHFPGHGDTAVDTHLQLATLRGDLDRLRRIELRAFRAAVEAGVDAIMLGHIAVPAIDPSGAPATLSADLARGLIRRELGFDGIVVTDAMEMAGIGETWTGEGAVRAVAAGADMVLLPPDARVAVQSLVRAVGEGVLTEARIDESVLRLLEIKERLGLDRERRVDLDGLGRAVGRVDDSRRARSVAESSITLVRNRNDVVPIAAEEPLRLLHLVMSSDVRNPSIQGILEEELELRAIEVETRLLGPEVAPDTAERVVAEARDFTHVLVSAFVRVSGSKGTADMSPSLATLVRRLAEGPAPVVAVSFGSPYLLRQFPEVDAYLCAYGAARSSQRAAIGALFGEFAIRGRLPVTLPGFHEVGHGVQMTRHSMTLLRKPPAEVGFDPGRLEEVARVVDDLVKRRAFPGAVVAVGREGALVHLSAHGRLSYEAGAPAVQADTIYDLASLTKVVVTTTLAMRYVDSAQLFLDRPISAYLPAASGGFGDVVTPRHLLNHSSGLDWGAPLHLEIEGRRAYVERILQMDLLYEPGSRSLYSDLGFILLGEILERIGGAPLEELGTRHVLGPLGMRDTSYLPPSERLERIAPTERDEWRGRMLRGEVHDENAYAMGGVAAHAGLFGTAEDLARFAQLMLNGGVFEHQRLVARATLEKFVGRAGVPGSSHALGWDTPSGVSSAGTLMSRESFGHLGFTGTSLWIDASRKLFVILLTNRVHPTRENLLIRDARPAVADAVVAALVEPDS